MRRSERKHFSTDESVHGLEPNRTELQFSLRSDKQLKSLNDFFRVQLIEIPKATPLLFSCVPNTEGNESSDYESDKTESDSFRFPAIAQQA